LNFWFLFIVFGYIRLFGLKEGILDGQDAVGYQHVIHSPRRNGSKVGTRSNVFPGQEFPFYVPEAMFL
jgi:hypothetical protein